MEKNGMGTLLSIIFLILGTTFLPEPIDAAPQDYKSRSERSPSPDPRCPNCPKDCPESLSGGLPEPESVVEQYSSMSKSSYSPPSYNAVQQQYSAQQPSPYAAPVQPPSPLYSVAQPPSRPPPPSYAAPHQAAYAHQPAAAYPSPPARPAYSVPPPSYELPPPPAHPAYGAPPPSYGLPPPPAQPAYGAPPPPPPPAFYAAPPPPQPPPASYNPPPPATPSPPASYNPPPPSPPASYNSQPPASYNLSPPRTSYDQSPPSRPPPPATEKPFKITLSRTSTSPPTKSPYPNKLPPPPAIPNEPPLSDKPCFKQPPPPPPKPENCNSLPMPRYNHLTNPWAQYRNFGYNPYAPSPYQPNYLNARPTYGYSCDDFDEDDEEEPVFSKYNRRSSDNRYYRHSGHHQDHFIDPLNSPTSMYKNYRPYERDEGRSAFSDEFGSEESTSSSKDQPRERLYVVYRADAIKDKIPSSLSPVINLSEDPSPMSDREIESMIRRAIEVSRLQRSHQDNVLYSRADPRYQYQHVSQQLDIAEQPEFKSLAQQQYDSQYPLGQYQMSPVQMMDNEGQYVVREEGDEVNNPGWDQTKWTAVPAMSGDFDNPENVYAANVGVSNGESVVPTEIQPAVTVPAAVVPPIEVGEEVQNPEEILQPESRLEKDIGESPSEVKENKTEEVDLIEDMETPQTVTEASSFDRHADTTTDDRM